VNKHYKKPFFLKNLNLLVFYTQIKKKSEKVILKYFIGVEKYCKKLLAMFSTVSPAMP
jgi:hypothetical protein